MKENKVPHNSRGNRKVIVITAKAPVIQGNELSLDPRAILTLRQLLEDNVPELKSRSSVHMHTPNDATPSRHARVIRLKARKVAPEKTPNIEDLLVSEVCPHCDAENTFVWDITKKGMVAFCAHCGNPMLICSMCEDQRCGRCIHEKE